MSITRLLLLPLLFAVTGCSLSVARPDKQSVTFTSTPDQATVMLNGTSLGTTPLTVPMTAEKSTAVIFRKEGYADATLTMTSEAVGAKQSELSTCCTTVQVDSGTAYQYRPDSYHVELVRVGVVPAQDPAAVGLTRDAKLKRYILANFEVLSNEVAQGTGERIDALRELMGYTAKPLPEFIAMIKPDFAGATDANAVAEKLILLGK